LINKKKLLRIEQAKKYFKIFLAAYSLLIFGINIFVCEILRVSHIGLENYCQIVNLIVLAGLVILPLIGVGKTSNELTKNNSYNELFFNTRITLKQYMLAKILAGPLLFLMLFGIFLVITLLNIFISFGHVRKFMLFVSIVYILFCILFIGLRVIYVCINIILEKYRAVFLGLIISAIGLLIYTYGITGFINYLYHKLLAISSDLLLDPSGALNIKYLYYTGFMCVVILTAKYLLQTVELKLKYFSSTDKVSGKQDYKSNFMMKDKEIGTFRLILWKELISLKRHKKAKELFVKLCIPLFILCIVFSLYKSITAFNTIIVISLFTIINTTTVVAGLRKYALVSSEQYCIKDVLYSKLNIDEFIFEKFCVYMAIAMICALLPVNIILLITAADGLAYLYCNIFAVSYVSAVIAIEYFCDAVYPNFNELKNIDNKINSRGELIAQILLGLYIWVVFSMNAVIGVFYFKNTITAFAFILYTSLANVLISLLIIIGMVIFYKRKGRLHWIL
jgi:hypothetical protein